MPIYAYRCEECGFAKDVLQKMSDDPLSICPQCAKASFKKQVTAAGFQLKGSGWYVTDFRGGNSNNGGVSANSGVAEAPPAAVSGTESAPVAGEKAATTPVAPAAPVAPVSTTTNTSSSDSKAA